MRSDPTPPCVILCGPQMGENIGACARAMKNCGLSDLRLVDPRDGWPNPAANAMAAHAEDIVEAATVFETLEEAVADLSYTYATTARARDQVKPVFTARGFAADARTRAGEGQKIGLLFGREREGLWNSEIALSSAMITVPLNPGNTSLNIGQAVLLVGYEWWTAADETPDRVLESSEAQPASQAMLDNFLSRLIADLDERSFLAVPEKRDRMTRNIRNIFQRNDLTENEINTLHGIVSFLKGQGGPRS
ncbi:MAG: RNA methyltransferase [Alphaproteobacteria bacterium]